MPQLRFSCPDEILLRVWPAAALARRIRDNPQTLDLVAVGLR